MLQNLQMQVQAIVESINRDRDSRHLIERSLADAIEAPGAETGRPLAIGPDDLTSLPAESPAVQPSTWRRTPCARWKCG